MCGILALFGNNSTIIDDTLRKKYLELSKLLRHRGPDWNGIYVNDDNKVIIAHERLSIIGVENGSQPIIDETNKYILSVNGEIYNYKQLSDIVCQGKYTFSTSSDCEIIMYLYKELNEPGIKLLDGIFSFVLYDLEQNDFLVARDPIGITPLYYGVSENDEILFASEMKAIQSVCLDIQVFPPGHYMRKDRKLVRYYNPKWLSNQYQSIDVYNSKLEEIHCRVLKDELTEAVHKRLMTDVPFGVLLSGGLDSSLIAAISNRYVKSRDNVWGNKLHSFSIGLKNSPDLKAAKSVADFLDTIHHEFEFTIQDGLDALRDVIYQLETYDRTTIRASTPMYLLSRKIKSIGIKMVLSGEGADEILGGYLYFHNAPNNKSFHEECCRRVSDLHYFDCLRANKSTMAWGVEARTPFLDKKFLEYAMAIDPCYKIKSKTDLPESPKIEKYILRKAFDTPDDPYLPDHILWRQKEQFSDGVGYGWIDHLIQHTDDAISDEEWNKVKETYPWNTPETKEELFYRNIFEEFYPKREKIVPKWVPRTDWDNVLSDPSGRAQTAHTCNSEW